MKSSNKEELKLEYQNLKSSLSNFLEELKRQLNIIVEKRGIKLAFPIQSRVKTWESIWTKIERIGDRFDKLQDIQDLAGLRVITVFREDAKIISDIVTEEFVIDREYNTSERLKEDQFGYASIHKVINLPDEWLKIPTLKPFKNYKAELQIRTASQHIWASASQVLNYKKEGDVPDSILRSIYRVSALLETVDLEFERTLKQKESYREEVSLKEDLNLNVDILEKLLDDILPEGNKLEAENYADLLLELSHFGIANVSDLRNLVSTHLDKVLKEDKKAASELLKEQKEKSHKGLWDHFNKERIENGYFFPHVGIVRNILKKEFGEKWKDFRKNIKRIA